MEGPEISELHELERVVDDPTAKAKRLSFSLLKDITNDFSEERILGAGGFGVVYKGMLPNGLAVAVRKMYLNQGLGGSEFENEVLTLMKVAHKNIVRFIGYCSHTQIERLEYNGEYVFAKSSEKLICMEYMPKGSLDKYINDNFHGGLGWNQRYQILIGICHGLRYLHDEVRIIHGDIKPDNILLDENLEPKINDFGLSRFRDEGESSHLTKDIMGTRGYMAPEIIDEGRWSIKADIFSFGVTIMTLLTGEGWYWIDRSLEEVRRTFQTTSGSKGCY